MKRQIVLSVLLMFLAYFVRGQSVTPTTLNSTGGTAAIGTNTYEWSVGEMALVNTASTGSIIVTQGMLQPVAGDPTSVKDSPHLTKGFQVYPNPATRMLNLQYDLPGGELLYLLQDITGKQLFAGTIITNGTQMTKGFDLTNLAPATYMLYIRYQLKGKPEETTSFKIDKLN